MINSDYSGESDLNEISELEMIMQQYELEQSLKQQEAENSHSRRYIPRERDVAEARLLADYFGDNPKYLETNFRRRFRMSRKLFLEIVQGIETYIETHHPLPPHFDFFRVRPDSTGLMSFSVIMKCTFGIRQLAYGITPDALDEYLQMGEHCARDCLNHFTMCIIQLYTAEFLRKPDTNDIHNLYNAHNALHGLPGMLESIDSGANNDLTVLYNSPLFDDLLDDIAPKVPFEVNGVTFDQGYYLADGIYPEWSSFVKSYVALSDKNAAFKRKQESARKDIERAFGVLQGRWHIIAQPTRAWTVNKLRRVMYTCIILHNMILKDQKFTISEMSEIYICPRVNLQRSWVERCEVQRKKSKELRDKRTHAKLQRNIIEHVWQRHLWQQYQQQQQNN